MFFDDDNEFKTWYSKIPIEVRMDLEELGIDLSKMSLLQRAYFLTQCAKVYRGVERRRTEAQKEAFRQRIAEEELKHKRDVLEHTKQKDVAMFNLLQTYVPQYIDAMRQKNLPDPSVQAQIAELSKQTKLLGERSTKPTQNVTLPQILDCFLSGENAPKRCVSVRWVGDTPYLKCFVPGGAYSRRMLDLWNLGATSFLKKGGCPYPKSRQLEAQLPTINWLSRGGICYLADGLEHAERTKRGTLFLNRYRG